MLMVRSPVLMAGLVGLLLSLGLPYLVVGMTIKRRVAAFTSRFPDAIDLLVRGLRSGLPVTETFQVVSHELRSEEHTSELQSLMRISYAVFCLKKKNENIAKQTIEEENNNTKHKHNNINKT